MSLVTSAVFTIVYRCTVHHFMFHGPLVLIDLGEANDVVTEQVSLRFTPASIISPFSHVMSSGVVQQPVLLFKQNLSLLSKYHFLIIGGTLTFTSSLNSFLLSFNSFFLTKCGDHSCLGAKFTGGDVLKVCFCECFSCWSGRSMKAD